MHTGADTRTGDDRPCREPFVDVRRSRDDLTARLNALCHELWHHPRMRMPKVVLKTPRGVLVLK
jgi:hypothetical protein